jgi:hypothetical protein
MFHVPTWKCKLNCVQSTSSLETRFSVEFAASHCTFSLSCSASYSSDKRMAVRYLFISDMNKYRTAIRLSDEYEAEQERENVQWEAANSTENLKALQKLRRHMPLGIRNLSEAELAAERSPNGQHLPLEIIPGDSSVPTSSSFSDVITMTSHECILLYLKACALVVLH